MSCSCNSTAALMDRNGPQWCRTNVDLLTESAATNARSLGHDIGTLEKIGITLVILANCRLAEGKKPTLIQRIAIWKARRYFASKCRPVADNQIDVQIKT